ncbi:glycosyltransferase [Bifidobacterium aquikefiricola]|uniref:Glycosyltransferase n=2 Tax=Bifidobacterium TaxID=1678 RepID=A0AB39U609_9BIFI
MHATFGKVEQVSSVPVKQRLWNVVFPPEDMGVNAHFAQEAAALYGAGYASDGDRLSASQLRQCFVDRTSIRIPAGSRFSSEGYFNGFPAAYWSAWTQVHSVTLTMHVSGEVRVRIWHSNSRARVTRVYSDEHNSGSLAVPVDISSLGAGGWLWFEVEAVQHAVVMSDAAWLSDSRPLQPASSVSLAITTMNKPEWCMRQFRLIARYADLSIIDRIVVVDQGTQHVEDCPGFAELEGSLSGKLHIIHQANIGGSGGFSRGMYEVLQQHTSGYALLLDDDTVIEPESISRAVAFARQCSEPTIVGGNMLFLTEPTRLCSLAETYNAKGVFWQAADGTPEFPDLAEKPFIKQQWLHRRADADYNAWWLCMIPSRVIETIGLAYPFFIKNDDVEYGVRAQEAGFRTVTVPGICLWHQSWFDKNDILDWQAYFHIRNKIIMGLLHSPYPCGGNLFRQMLKASLSATVKMRYSAVQLHIMAVEDILQGPEHVGKILSTRIADIRAMLSHEPDAQTKPIDQLPKLVRERNTRQTRALRTHALLNLFHQLTPPRLNNRRIVDGYIEPTKIYGPINDRVHVGRLQVTSIPPERYTSLPVLTDRRSDHWKAMSAMDSALTVDVEHQRGTLLLRHPLIAAAKLSRVIAAYFRLACQWNTYRRRYRAAFAEMTSPDWWQRKFHM